MLLRKYLGPRDFYKRALGIAIPVMAQQFIQTLVSLIDNFMVAGLGDIKMSGVNVAGQIFFVFFGGHCLAVIYTERDDRTRIISARRADKKERRIYYGNSDVYFA